MFEFANSNLTLKRLPAEHNDSFQAWDASDEYIINILKEDESTYQRILIIEDEFGALTCKIKALDIFLVNDSILSQKSIKSNLVNNNIDDEKIKFLSPYEDFPSNIDLVIIKIPKSNNYLHYLLDKINKKYPANTPILAGAMVKYLNKTIYKLFNQYLSHFTYSLSWKKAKIIRGNISDYVGKENFLTKIEDYGITLINYPNLFSYNKIDLGTSFLLNNLPNIPLSPKIDNIVDLGSGNGILAFSLIEKYPLAHFWLSDILYSAQSSVYASIDANKFNRTNMTFILDNELSQITDNSVDLVVTNPPFHQNHKLSLNTSLNLFNESARMLKKSGYLLVVANNHLGYHIHLKRNFNEVTIINSNNKFIILLASNPFV